MHTGRPNFVPGGRKGTSRGYSTTLGDEGSVAFTTEAVDTIASIMCSRRRHCDGRRRALCYPCWFVTPGKWSNPRALYGYDIPCFCTLGHDLCL